MLIELLDLHIISVEDPVVQGALKGSSAGVEKFINRVSNGQDVSEFAKIKGGSAGRLKDIVSLYTKSSTVGRALRPIQAASTQAVRGVSVQALAKGLVVLVLFLAAVLACAWSCKMVYVFLGFEQAAQASDKARLAQLEQDVADLRKTNTAIADENAKLEKRMNLLETTSSKAETTRAGMYAAAEKERTEEFKQEQKERASAANATLKVMKENTEELGTQVAGLVVNLGNAKAELGKVSGDLKEARREMSDVNNSVSPLKKEVNGLKTGVAAMKKDVVKLENASDRLEKASTTWMYMMIAGVVTGSLIWLACWCMVDTSVRKVKDLDVLNSSHDLKLADKVKKLEERVKTLEDARAEPHAAAMDRRNRPRGRANAADAPGGPEQNQ